MVAEYCDLNNLKSYAIWIFWILFANFVMCQLQTLQMDPLYSHIRPDLMPHDDEIGLMRLKATLGVFAAVTSPILFIASPWLCLISLPLLFYAESSAAVLAFALSLSFILYFRNKWLFYVLGAAMLIGGITYIIIYDMPGGQFGERFRVWGMAFSQVIKMSPFFGHGIGLFARWAPQTSQGGGNPDALTWIWAHNEYLQVLFELGIIGVVSIVMCIKGVVKDFMKNFEDRELQCLFACFLALLVVSFFHFPFHIARMAGISLFLIALLQAKSTSLEDAKNEEII